MNRVAFIVPGPLDRRSGGSEYDRRIAAGLRAAGWPVDVREVDASFPRPSVAASSHAARVLAAVSDGTTVVVDGLAFGAMAELAEREAARLRLVALVHMPLADEAGIDPAEAGRLEAGERRAVAAAGRAIVTARGTARIVEEYGVPRAGIAVVEPGTDPAPLAAGTGGVDPWVQLLSVAALTPGKGHGVLVRALRQIPRTGWHLTCVGSLERDAGTTSRVRDEVREGGLERHLSFVGELTGPALAAAYHGADVFVHPTLSETFGMVVAEALARGLPVVSTTTGAIPDLVGGDAGLLVAPGDEQAFADALSRIVTDAGLRGRLAEGARRVRDRLPTWEAAVAAFAAALRRFESDDAAPR